VIDPIAQEMAFRYARIMDDRCFDELDEIMVEDIVVASPDFDCQGLAAFKEQVQLLHDFSATMHLVGNIFGSWDGDTYQGETYCVASHISDKEGVQRNWEVGIRYQDSIIKVGDGYKYSRRYLNVLWQSDRPLQL
jgi:hypothetical protein